MENDKIIVANMKMNMVVDDISKYLKKINGQINSSKVIICPTSIYIPYFLKQDYEVGIQNLFLRSEGAYTGEVSPKQASSMGIKYAIIGHSERRIYFDENDITINKKLKETLNNGLKVILCVGETKEEKNLLKTERVIRRQVVRALSDVDKTNLKNVIIAYEPVWSIGTNETPTKEEITKTINHIKSIIEEKYDYENIQVIYGGSVNETNIKSLCEIKNISGFLVGGASNNADKFLKIVKEVAL